MLPLLAEDEVLGVERLVVLGVEEVRRPPSLEALEGIPLLLPEALQMEHEYGLLDWIFEGLSGLINLESLLDEEMDVEVLDDEVQLSYLGVT